MTTTNDTRVTAEHEERSRRVAVSAHSARMEGLTVSPATLVDADEYIAGQVTTGEMVRRLMDRYGLDGAPKPSADSGR